MNEREILEHIVRDQERIEANTARLHDAVTSHKEWTPAGIVEVCDVVVDDWATEVFAAITGGRVAADHHDREVTRLVAWARVASDFRQKLRSELEASKEFPPRLPVFNEALSKATTELSVTAAKELIGHLDAFVTSINEVVVTLRDEIRFMRLEHHAEVALGKSVLPNKKGKRGPKPRPEYVRLFAVLRFLHRVGINGPAHVATRVCKRWMAGEVAARWAGHRLTQTEFECLWDKKIKPSDPDIDRVEYLRQRFEKVYQRGGRNYRIPTE